MRQQINYKSVEHNGIIMVQHKQLLTGVYLICTERPSSLVKPLIS